jgi:methyl coenzyme M reductase gamma subunit
MPKNTFAAPPITCIETKQLTISFLNQHGLLEPGHRQLTMSWSVRGQETGSMSADVIITDEQSFLLLSYQIINGRTYEYQVDLVRVASNLPGSTASRFYMVCPVTGRRASILYLREGTELFAHRQAYRTKRLYYDSQLELKRYRGLSKNAVVQKIQQREYGRKYRKVVYAGKETKWSMNLDVKALSARIATAQAILRLGPY